MPSEYVRKGGWGGRRKGNGPRKKPVSREVAERALERIDEENEWAEQ